MYHCLKIIANEVPLLLCVWANDAVYLNMEFLDLNLDNVYSCSKILQYVIQKKEVHVWIYFFYKKSNYEFKFWEGVFL